MNFNIQDHFGRLDHVLSELIPQVSRTKLKADIKAGLVQLDGQVVTKPASPVDDFNRITYSAEIKEPNSEAVLEPTPMALEIHYEDEHVLVVNKPRGLLVHPGDNSTEPTLVSGLLAHTELAKTDDPKRPGIVHRLDRHTEGLLLIAKTDAAYVSLKDQFKSRSVIKKYYAMLKGNLPQNEYHLDTMMGRHRQQRYRQTSKSPVEGTEKQAITTIKVIERFNTKTFCDVQIHTGRTHQIRVHCAELGYPVIGDSVYDPNCGKHHDGQQLQAYYLQFQHPSNGETLTIQLDASSVFG